MSMDSDLRSEIEEALSFLERFHEEHPWHPPTGPFVVSDEHRELIAELEARLENRDGSLKKGVERSYRLEREWLRRPKQLLARPWNPSSNSSARWTEPEAAGF
jgi:hypothetical protein